MLSMECSQNLLGDVWEWLERWRFLVVMTYVDAAGIFGAVPGAEVAPFEEQPRCLGWGGGEGMILGVMI